MASMGIPAPSSAGGGVGYTFANKFTVSGATPINFIRWWKDGTSPFPNEIRIRDITAGTTLLQIGPTPATWVADVDQWYTLDIEANGYTPPDLVVGHDYGVVEYGENTGYRQAYGDFVAPDPATGITFVRSYWDPGNLAMPTAANSLPTCYGLDVLTTLPVPGPGEGTGTLTSDLFSWLSTDPVVQTHESDGIPWYVYALANLWNSGLGDAAEGYFGRMEALVNAIKDVTDLLPDQLSDQTDIIIDALTSGLTGIQSGLDTIQAGVDALTGGSGGTAGGPLGALSGRSGFPTELWTMTDETDFTDALSWDVPADLYVLTITTLTPRLAVVPVDGAPWVPRAGWWAIRNGDSFGGRQYVDWLNNHLQDGGRRMPGVVVSLQETSEAHIQAWTLT